MHQGNPTIGYGHNCNAHKDYDNFNPPISIAEGEELLRKDLAMFERCVDEQTPGLNSNQFDALVSLAFIENPRWSRSSKKAISRVLLMSLEILLILVGKDQTV